MGVLLACHEYCTTLLQQSSAVGIEVIVIGAEITSVVLFVGGVMTVDVVNEEIIDTGLVIPAVMASAFDNDTNEVGEWIDS